MNSIKARTIIDKREELIKRLIVEKKNLMEMPINSSDFRRQMDRLKNIEGQIKMIDRMLDTMTSFTL